MIFNEREFMLNKILILILFPIYVFAWKMESGSIKLNDTYDDANWVQVSLQQTYDTPPLIFLLPTSAGGDPCALRIKNVTKDSFEVLQVEPADEDGPHVKMTVNYLAIDSGEHFLSDGTRIVAGKISTKAQQAYKNVDIETSWEHISFDDTFADTPIVLGMIQTLNNEEADIPNEASKPFLTTVIDNVDSSGFDIALERSEAVPGDVNNTETIAYLAIDNDKNGTISTIDENILYEIASKDDVKGKDDGCYNYEFKNQYSDAPNVLATKQTRKGNNGGWFRRCNLDENETGLFVDEDQYNDSERSHIKEVAGIFVLEKAFVFDSALLVPMAEYRMDQCYWLGTGVFDVMDNTGANNAESYNNAQTDKSDVILGFSGAMGATGYIEPEDIKSIGDNWTFALWIKFPLDDTNHDSFSISGTNNKYYYHALGSIEDEGDLPAILKEKDGDDLMWELYDANGDDVVADLPDDLDGWHHFVFVQADSKIKLYLDGSYLNEIDDSISGNVEAYLTSLDSADTQSVGASVDELKLWARTLSKNDIEVMYNNEKNGKNYDGSTRDEIVCGANIDANSWELVGIPADLRKENNTSIDKIFGDNFNGEYGSDWRIYKRVYSDTNNSSSYIYLDDVNTALKFGEAYWLGSKNSENWNVNDMQEVDYNSTNGACVSETCVEIDLKSVSLNEDIEDTNGTGPYRYFMTGFVGKSPVDWADCRIIIDGSAYTPSDAQTEGYIDKQIWQYNPDSDDADSKGYTTCDDVTPGNCKLVPYKGFWIELHGSTKDKTIKLLIPKE